MSTTCNHVAAQCWTARSLNGSKPLKGKAARPQNMLEHGYTLVNNQIALSLTRERAWTGTDHEGGVACGMHAAAYVCTVDMRVHMTRHTDA